MSTEELLAMRMMASHPQRPPTLGPRATGIDNKVDHSVLDSISDFLSKNSGRTVRPHEHPDEPGFTPRQQAALNQALDANSARSIDEAGTGLMMGSVNEVGRKLIMRAADPVAGELPIYRDYGMPVDPWTQSPDATHIRLYRGVGPVKSNASLEADGAKSLGSWFTDSLEGAKHWANGGHVVYTDVPVEVAKKGMRGPVGGVDGYVFNLPPDYQRDVRLIWKYGKK